VQYQLDIQLLLQTLMKRRSSGVITATVAAGPIEMVLEQGNIISCRFANLSGQEALQATMQLGVVLWTFTLQSQRETPSSAFAQNAHFQSRPQKSGPFRPSETMDRPFPFSRTVIPQRTMMSVDTITMPRGVLLVYACIDGKTTVAEIAQRSAQPIPIVMHVLQYLYTQNFITLTGVH
jgi:hypothetical protein